MTRRSLDDPTTEAADQAAARAASDERPEPAPQADADAPARRSLALLGDRTFGPYFAGKVLSTIGVWIHNIAAAILVWELTRSTLLVGAVSVGQFLPQFFLAPWSGARADRGDRRKQLIFGRMVTVVGSGGLALWIAIVGVEGTSGAVAVIGAATVVGIGFALGAPAMNALIPALVRPSELPSAIALGGLPMTIARSAGPALGAVLVATAGPAITFTVAALLNITFTVIIAVIHIRDVQRPRSSDTSVRAGWRYLRADASMSALMLGVITIGLGADPVITLTPAIADRLGEPSSFVGPLASAFGIGAAIGFLVLSRMQVWFGLPRLGVTGLLGLGIGMAALAVAPTPVTAILALGVGGLGMAFALTSLTTMIQQQVPEDLRGRVMALWGVAFLGSRPIAAGATGALTDATSVGLSLALVAGCIFAGAYIVRPRRLNPYRVPGKQRRSPAG
jgi:MFS family permease